MRLDEVAAQQAAEDHAAIAGYDAEVEVAELDVTVTISDATDFEILPGSAGYTVSATAHVTEGSGA